GWRSARIATQLGHTPHGSAVAPPCPSGPVQFSARAMMRAVVVLPTPRTPVSMKACATRPVAKALRRMRTIASWPIRSSKRAGRYLRASTRRGVAEQAGARWGRRRGFLSRIVLEQAGHAGRTRLTAAGGHPLDGVISGGRPTNDPSGNSL